MNIFELMEARKTNYTATDAHIYELIRKWPDVFANEKISYIIKQFELSQAALTRFAKKLGFDGFNVFQYQFKTDYEKINTSKFMPSSNMYGEYLKEVEDYFSQECINSIASRIFSSQNVILGGSNLSNLPAKYFQYSLNFTSLKPAFIYNPSEGIIPTTSNDVFILFSVNNGILYRDYLKGTISNPYSPYKILVTFSQKHGLIKYFDEVVVLPEAHLTQTKSTVLPDTFAFLLFSDSVINRLYELASTK